jgi:1-acyl-sn-glycerol-3-phosphate acyltransferase
MVLKRLSRWMLYSVMKWKRDVTQEHPRKFIICLAPHTSNVDFLIGQLYMRAENMKSNFLMKKEWFFWPLGILARRVGGIPVNRSKKTRLTEQLAEEAKKRDYFCLTITPEGTRSLNPDWKKGFYYIALNAGIPILLYGVDYEKKLIRCTKTVYPTGNVEQDIKEIKLYFKDFKGKHPEKFTIGDIEN